MPDKRFKIDRGCSDLLKIISALLVMFSHYYSIKGQNGFELNTFEWLIRSQGGNIGVAIFFFLSGYGLMTSEINSHLTLRQYLRKRITKIYFPVLLITSIWLPIYYSFTPPTAKNIAYDLFVGFKDPVLWFIRSLILLYITFYLSTIFLNKKREISLLILVVGTILTCGVNFITNGDFGLNSIASVPLFSIGVLSAMYSKKIFRFIHISLIPLCISFLAISIVMSFFPRFIANISHLAMDYLTVTSIILLFSNCSPRLRIPAILSIITFDIYLVHYKILIVMNEVTNTFPILIFIIYTIICAIALYLLRSNLNLIKLWKRIPNL